MGAKSSKNSTSRTDVNALVNGYGPGGGKLARHELGQSKFQSKVIQETKQANEAVSIVEGGNEDDFYDGIPRFQGGLSHKYRSMSSRAATVLVVSAHLGKAGTFGLEKAVQALDTLGSSMTNLNTGCGFLSGPTTKGSELSVLAFEVANTIMKCSSLMQSLSKRSIRHLEEVVFPSQGVQNLVSKDVDELLRTIASDKRVELNILSKEVIRFGNRCKDPQWHNLERYFEKERGLAPPKLSKDDTESVMEQLMTLVQCTAELYHELQRLNILEEAHQRKHIREPNLYSNSIKEGDNPKVVKANLKSQRKQVKLLKKKSLWSMSMEEVMEKLVGLVVYLNQEIQSAFGCAYDNASSSGSVSIQQKLGPAGLALHYANIVLQIDSIVARSSCVTSSVKDALYQNLPPNIKSSLRAKIHSFSVEEELSITEIKAEMEKTLCWLAPIATNTAKAHHGFGWVGEWANTGSDWNRKPVAGVTQIETLNYADKERTEGCILELVLWLNHLIRKSKEIATPILTTPLDTSFPILSTDRECCIKQSKSLDIDDDDDDDEKLRENKGQQSFLQLDKFSELSMEDKLL